MAAAQLGAHLAVELLARPRATGARPPAARGARRRARPRTSSAPTRSAIASRKAGLVVHLGPAEARSAPSPSARAASPARSRSTLAGLDAGAARCGAGWRPRRPGPATMTWRAASPSRPGAAGLLVELLERVGQRRVHHQAHVRDVHAHAEGVRRRHRLHAPGGEGVLGLGPVGAAGVVGDRRVAGGVERTRPSPRPPCGCRSRRSPCRPPAERSAASSVAALARHRALALDPDRVEGEVRPVEAADHLDRVAQAEAAGDVGAHLRRGRGGERHGRRAGRRRSRKRPDAPVVGAELVAPLGHAVGLVDDQQGDAGRRPSRAGRLAEWKRSGAT